MGQAWAAAGGPVNSGAAPLGAVASLEKDVVDAAALGGPQGGLAGPLLPELRVLDVGYCPLPAPVLAELVCRASRLHSLSINGCRAGVTDALWPLLHRRVPEPAVPGLLTAPPAAEMHPDSKPFEPSCQAPAALAAASEPAGAPLAAGEAGPAALPRAPITARLDAAAAPPSDLAAASAPCRQHELRSLSMVGSKELRHFCLGLMPPALAQEHDLLAG